MARKYRRDSRGRFAGGGGSRVDTGRTTRALTGVPTRGSTRGFGSRLKSAANSPAGQRAIRTGAGAIGVAGAGLAIGQVGRVSGGRRSIVGAADRRAGSSRSNYVGMYRSFGKKAPRITGSTAYAMGALGRR